MLFIYHKMGFGVLNPSLRTTYLSYQQRVEGHRLGVDPMIVAGDDVTLP